MYNFIVTITNNSYINMYVTLHPNSLGQYLRKTDIESWLFNFIFHSHNKYCVEHWEFNNSNQLQNSSIETKKLVLCRLSLVQLSPLLFVWIFAGMARRLGWILYPSECMCFSLTVMSYNFVWWEYTWFFQPV